MRVVEHRRHSRRDPDSGHLSREGLAIARRVAPTLGRFDRVVSSPIPRAVETAEALGFPPDALLRELALIPEEMERLVERSDARSFADYVGLTRKKRSATAYARSQSELMRRQLELVPEGGHLLIVSHGGVIEFGAAGARPDDALAFGDRAGHLEGIRLYLEGRTWVRGEVLRVPP